jgi:predicted chitinase
MQINDLLTFEEQLAVAYEGPWMLVENFGPVSGTLWAASLADKKQRFPDIEEKIKDFIRVKSTNPTQAYGAKDTSFNSRAPIGCAVPKLKHAHLTRDVSVFYTIEGRNPIQLRLYGVFDHRESGIGTPANINKEKSIARQLTTSFNEDVEEGWKSTLAGTALGLAGGLAGLGQFNQPAQTTAPVSANVNANVGVKPQAAPLGKLDISTPQGRLERAAMQAGLQGTELDQFMSQAAHETANFTATVEAGTKPYFIKKYEPVFKKHPKTHKWILDPKTNQPQNFNKVARRLGNTQAGDGTKYIGRGYMMLTGRDNYTRCGAALGMDLVNHPELAATQDGAIKTAIWFWKHQVSPKVGDFTNVAAVTKKINPGTTQHSLQSRQAQFGQRLGSN